MQTKKSFAHGLDVFTGVRNWGFKILQAHRCYRKKNIELCLCVLAEPNRIYRMILLCVCVYIWTGHVIYYCCLCMKKTSMSLEWMFKERI